ncbi:MAG: adenylate/guanylate cyclase domain-containing protein [Deltaproteobacteria bacterium]|nr:adenylate/guanylate cyclase domain-containing protein [Deltaproteobacteria bacterium]
MTSGHKRPAFGKDDLYEQLLEWSLDGVRDNQALSSALWSAHGKDRAVLVSDLSGFTRITRQRGLLQFLAVFERARRIGEAAFTLHGGRYLKHEADNLIALFDTPGAAAACARTMLWEAKKHNAGVSDVAGHVRFCIGISYGHIMELSDDAFGDAVNVAFKLGEDVAKADEILVSEDARTELAKSLTHKDLHALLCDPTGIDLSGVHLTHYRLPPREK